MVSSKGSQEPDALTWGEDPVSQLRHRYPHHLAARPSRRFQCDGGILHVNGSRYFTMEYAAVGTKRVHSSHKPHLGVEREFIQRLWLQECARDSALSDDPLPVSALRARGQQARVDPARSTLLEVVRNPSLAANEPVCSNICASKGHSKAFWKVGECGEEGPQSLLTDEFG